MKLLVLLILLSMISCSSDTITDTTETQYSTEISTVDIEFKQELGEKTLLEYEDSLEIADDTVLAKSVKAKVKVTDTLQVIGTIPAPVIDGETLQATDIYIITQGKKRAYVSYNTSGDVFKGALQIVDITGGGKFVEVDQTIIFENRDINTVSYDDGYVYLAGASEDEASFSSPAFAEIIKTTNQGLIPDDYQTSDDNDAYRVIDLPSFAATGIRKVDDRLYVTVGADGGKIVAIEEPESDLSNGLHLYSEFADVEVIDFDDARYVDYGSNYVAAVSGTNLWYQDRETNSSATITISSDAIQYSKSTVDLFDWFFSSYAYVSNGAYGTSIYNLKTGTLTQEIPQQIIEGVSSDLTVTNAVTGAWNYYLFTADGEGGVRVFKKTLFSTTFDEITSIRFGDGLSANAIMYYNKYLFVACGKAGVKVLYKSVDSKFSKAYSSEDDFYGE